MTAGDERLQTPQTRHVGYRPVFALADGIPIGYDVEYVDFGTAAPETLPAEDLDDVAAGLARSAPELGTSWVFLAVTAAQATRPRIRSTFPSALRLVLSIHASERALDDPQVIRRLAASQNSGRSRLALVGVGGPVTGLVSVADLRPGFIRLDRRLTDDVVRDRVRQALVGSLAYFASETGATLVADFVETEVQRRTLARLGVAAGVGPVFGAPRLHPPGLMQPARRSALG